MLPEELKKYGKEGSQHPGEVLHQRRKLPFSPMQMAVAGFIIVASIGYFTLYTKAKPEATAVDVMKATAGVRDDDRNRKSK